MKRARNNFDMFEALYLSAQIHKHARSDLFCLFSFLMSCKALIIKNRVESKSLATMHVGGFICDKISYGFT